MNLPASVVVSTASTAGGGGAGAAGWTARAAGRGGTAVAGAQPASTSSHREGVEEPHDRATAQRIGGG